MKKTIIFMAIAILLIPLAIAPSEEIDMESYSDEDLINNIIENPDNPESIKELQARLQENSEMIAVVNSHPEVKEAVLKDNMIGFSGDMKSVDFISYSEGNVEIKGKVREDGSRNKITFNLEHFGMNYVGAKVTEEGCLEAQGFRMCSGELTYEESDGSFTLRDSEANIEPRNFSTGSSLRLINSKANIGEGTVLSGTAKITSAEDGINIKGIDAKINNDYGYEHTLSGEILFENDNHWNIKKDTFLKVDDKQGNSFFLQSWKDEIDYYQSTQNGVCVSDNCIQYGEGKLKVLSYGEEHKGDISIATYEGNPLSDLKVVTGNENSVAIDYQNGILNFDSGKYMYRGDEMPTFSFTTLTSRGEGKIYENYFDPTSKKIMLREIDEEKGGLYYNYMPSDSEYMEAEIATITTKKDFILLNGNDGTITQKDIDNAIEFAKERGMNPEYSVVDLFWALGLRTDFAYREEVYELYKNSPYFESGQEEYKGTSSQNLALIDFVMNGKEEMRVENLVYYENRGRAPWAVPLSVPLTDAEKRAADLRNERFYPTNSCNKDSCALDTRTSWEYMMKGEISIYGWGNAWDYRDREDIFNKLDWNNPDFEGYQVGDIITIHVAGSSYNKFGQETHTAIVVGETDDPTNPIVRSVEGANNIRVRTLRETLVGGPSERTQTLALRHTDTPQYYDKEEFEYEQNEYLAFKPGVVFGDDLNEAGMPEPVSLDPITIEEAVAEATSLEPQDNQLVSETKRYERNTETVRITSINEEELRPGQSIVINDQGEKVIELDQNHPSQKVKESEGGLLITGNEYSWQGITRRYNQDTFREGWEIIDSIRNEVDTDGTLTHEEKIEFSRRLRENEELKVLSYNYRYDRYRNNKIDKLEDENLQRLVNDMHFNAPAPTISSIGGNGIRVSDSVAENLNGMNTQEKEEFAKNFGERMFSYYNSKEERYSWETNVNGWMRRLSRNVNEYLEGIGSTKRYRIISSKEDPYHAGVYDLNDPTLLALNN